MIDDKIYKFIDRLEKAEFRDRTLAPKIWKALKMFKKEKNLLYIDKTGDSLKAVVKSQSHPEKLEYALTLKAYGTFFCGTQNRLNFVPEHHTDFIFCVIAEEGGFLAAVSLILLFLILLKLCLAVIVKTTDREGKLLAAGITVMLFFQVFINIGMTIGLCPITGLPLPLVSYGGSSLLTYFAAFGLLISVYKERSIF